MGDIISLLTTSLASIRSLQVTLPLLRDYGITSNPEDAARASEVLLPNLDLLRHFIDDKLDSSNFASLSPAKPRSILIDPSPPIIIKKREEKALSKEF